MTLTVLQVKKVVVSARQALLLSQTAAITLPYHRSQVSIAACSSCKQQQKRVYNTTPGATILLCLLPALTGRMMRSHLGDQFNHKSSKVPTQITVSWICIFITKQHAFRVEFRCNKRWIILSVWMWKWTINSYNNGKAHFRLNLLDSLE